MCGWISRNLSARKRSVIGWIVTVLLVCAIMAVVFCCAIGCTFALVCIGGCVGTPASQTSAAAASAANDPAVSDIDPAEHASVVKALAAAQAELRERGWWIFPAFTGLCLVSIIGAGLLKSLVPGRSWIFLGGSGVIGAVVGVAFARHDTTIGWIGLVAICLVIVGALAWLVIAYRSALIANLKGIEAGKPSLSAISPAPSVTVWDAAKGAMRVEQERGGAVTLTDGHLEDLGFKEPSKS